MTEAPVRLVIVDDSESVLALLADLVAPLVGREATTTFKDPTAGLAWCLANPVDLIIVDYWMPNMNGLQFIEAFRHHDNRADVPIMMVTTFDMKEVRHQALQLGATDFLNKPIDTVELVARLNNLLTLRHHHRETRSYAARLAEEVAQATREIVERERETILVLARAAEFRDNETGAHLQRMSSYSRLIGQRLGLGETEAERLFLAAPMHDVGKIGIPDNILLKPGPLTEEEWTVMASHPVIGWNILHNGTSEILRVAAEIAVSHHEKWDGSGYPFRLNGAAIPLVGRITAIADVFDALTSRRPYKPAWPFDRTIEHMRAERGRHFDPDCLDAFFDSIDAVIEVARRSGLDHDESPVPVAAR
jgi:putative two-component system response regulator